MSILESRLRRSFHEGHFDDLNNLTPFGVKIIRFG